MSDRRVTSRLNMANAVKEVCDTNTSIVDQVPAFVLLVIELGNRTTALRVLNKKLKTKNSGYADQKAYWKEQLALLLSVICGAGVSYAQKINDVVLEQNFDYPISTFTEMRDTELIELAQSIIDLQATVAAQLLDYGITTAFMTEVNEALDNFEEVNPKPIVNVYTAEADRKKLIEGAFALSEFVLQNMMKAALIYKVLNPIFYQSLDNASLIRNSGLRHEQDPVKEAVKLQELAEKKLVQNPPSTAELLEGNVQEINALSENTATPALPEPVLNGHGEG